MFCKKGVLKNFAKFTRKHLCWSLFLNKVLGLKSAILLKERPKHKQVFSYEFRKIFKNTFFTEHLRATVSVSTNYDVILTCIKINFTEYIENLKYFFCLFVFNVKEVIKTINTLYIQLILLRNM